MNKAIFTVNVGGYDFQPYPALNNPGWDKILVTDDPPPQTNRGWDRVIEVEITDRPDLASKRWKWLSHKLLPEYDLVCYHDANVHVRKSIPNRPFRILHRKRCSIRQEAKALNDQRHRWTEESVNKQVEAYMEEGFPDNLGLHVGSFFARPHNEEYNKVYEEVWNQLNKYTSRDMLSFTYAMWKHGQELDYNEVMLPGFYKTYVRHNHHRNKKPKIYGE